MHSLARAGDGILRRLRRLFLPLLPLLLLLLLLLLLSLSVIQNMTQYGLPGSASKMPSDRCVCTARADATNDHV